MAPHTYQSSGSGMSVPSVSTELTVWCENGVFAWNAGGVVVTHPADDPAGAALLIMRHQTGSAGPGEDDRPPRTPRDQ
ncbi:hypothetical protein [Microtetraspora niveoalba]|uniref:hypothetical protein n=1 Tax=Microtetraspora niveoalba TaxID=46175 RepID=UPI0012F825C7|nr:hypothetical protein [Microtetraspora niveoalba]